ncbi:uncharacterized protein LOC111710985 [Eurytemora carolleeae]|uniref:uncharacterized protein LOC111710985 n=1 Tax=Eurytemora carolleeae TaxID=1294199 RepID=UPI000C79059C|nr:uncharacterized protein LOC111710985 [Eurytemora carolleeae]|eukprot:XP_023340964.1 uncharacterized protein LOC111710985 [Eurytemora affinis]
MVSNGPIKPKPLITLDDKEVQIISIKNTTTHTTILKEKNDNDGGETKSSPIDRKKGTLGEVKPEPSLPPGWRKEFSKKEKRHYFFNSKTKMSVWNLDDVMKEPNLLKQRNMESTNKLKDISLLEEKTGSDEDQILQMKILLEKLKSNKDQILPEKPKTNKNTVLLEKTKAKKNSKDKTKSNKEMQVNDDSSNLKESDIQDKVSPKPVKKKVDEDDFDLMLNISDTENRFTDDDMEEEEEEKAYYNS